jgi:hypothetical protein
MRTQKLGFCINLDRQVSVNHNPLNPKFLKETRFPSIHPVTVTIACLVYLQGGVHPAVAHNIQTDGTVGATFHIEPDHNPHAGEPATAWFALTTSGGEPLPLSQCDCRLAVYDRAVNPSVPILTPPLKAIAAEQYRDIPGAEVIFPQAGIYELEISGSPKSDADFEAFSLTYSVTVRPGKAPETPPVSVPSRPTTPTADDSIGKWHWMAIGLGGFIAALTLWVWRRKASQ